MLFFQQLLGCNSKALPGTLFAAASGGAGVALHSALNARRLLVVVVLPFLLLPLAPYVMLSAAEVVAAAADGYDGTSSIVHRVLTYEPFRLHTSTASDLTVGYPHIHVRVGKPAGDQTLETSTFSAAKTTIWSNIVAVQALMIRANMHVLEVHVCECQQAGVTGSICHKHAPMSGARSRLKHACSFLLCRKTPQHQSHCYKTVDPAEVD